MKRVLDVNFQKFPHALCSQLIFVVAVIIIVAVVALIEGIYKLKIRAFHMVQVTV